MFFWWQLRLHISEKQRKAVQNVLAARQEDAVQERTGIPAAAMIQKKNRNGKTARGRDMRRGLFF